MGSEHNLPLGKLACVKGSSKKREFHLLGLPMCLCLLGSGGIRAALNQCWQLIAQDSESHTLSAQLEEQGDPGSFEQVLFSQSFGLTEVLAAGAPCSLVRGWPQITREQLCVGHWASGPAGHGNAIKSTRARQVNLLLLLPSESISLKDQGRIQGLLGGWNEASLC